LIDSLAQEYISTLHVLLCSIVLVNVLCHDRSTRRLHLCCDSSVEQCHPVVTLASDAAQLLHIVQQEGKTLLLRAVTPAPLELPAGWGSTAAQPTIDAHWRQIAPPGESRTHDRRPGLEYETCESRPTNCSRISAVAMLLFRFQRAVPSHLDLLPTALHHAGNIHLSSQHVI